MSTVTKKLHARIAKLEADNDDLRAKLAWAMAEAGPAEADKAGAGSAGTPTTESHDAQGAPTEAAKAQPTKTRNSSPKSAK